jgi:hypothetical protein
MGAGRLSHQIPAEITRATASVMAVKIIQGGIRRCFGPVLAIVVTTFGAKNSEAEEGSLGTIDHRSVRRSA